MYEIYEGTGLSCRQHRIALLAAEGLTNQQIGHAVGLSARTVGAHLNRVFPKLAVTHRSQLAKALGGRAESGSDPGDAVSVP